MASRRTESTPKRDQIPVAHELERTLQLYAEYLRLSAAGPFSWYRQATAIWPHRPDAPLSIVTWEEPAGAGME